MTKNLIFRVCGEDFKNFANKTHNSRFREATPHWQSRLLDKEGNFKNFDEIHIINGYSKDSPTIIAKFGKIIPAINEKGIAGFEIQLGEIKEIRE